jgi:phage terminase large subunit-like protein
VAEGDRRAAVTAVGATGKPRWRPSWAHAGCSLTGWEGAEVVVVASDARQAGITHRQVARMIALEPRLAEQVQVFQNRIYVPHTDSTLTVLPAEPGALQGWNPSLVIVDELHVAP